MILNEEMNGTKRLLSNIIYLFFGGITTKIIGAIAGILYARVAGPDISGYLGIALSFSAIVIFCTDSGISQTTVREGVKPKADVPSIMYSYIKTRLYLFVLVTIGSIVFATLLYSDNPDTYYAVLFLTIPSLLGALLQGIGTTYFQMIEQMKYVSFINVIASVGTSLALLCGVFLNVPFLYVCLIYGLSSIIAGLFSTVLVLKRIKIKKEINNKIFNQLMSFTLNGLIIMLIPMLGPLILEKLLTVGDVGMYSQAFRIPSVLYQFPAIIATAFYPKLFALGAENKIKEHRKTNALELKLMGGLGMILSLPFVLAPEYWIRTLLGVKYLPAVPALVILSYLVFTQAVKYPLSDYLTTSGKPWARTIILSVGLVVAVVAYYVLGSTQGIAGGAIAPILSDLVVILGCAFVIPKGFKFIFENTYVIFIGFVVSYLAYQFILNQLHPLIGITLAEFIFIGILLIGYKEIRNQIIQFIQRRRAA